MSGIYERSSSLADYSRKSACVIGAGGVGSWMALFCALLGMEYIIVVDDDIIEEHNLNRTPFRTNQIGASKIDAVEELILERRELCVIEKHFSQFDMSIIKDKNIDYIFDCTDSTLTQSFFQSNPNLMKKYIKLGYDGWSMTWDRSLTPAWGEDSSYSVTPSVLIPPVFLSIQALLLLTNDIGYGKCRTFDCISATKQFYDQR